MNLPTSEKLQCYLEEHLNAKGIAKLVLTDEHYSWLNMKPYTFRNIKNKEHLPRMDQAVKLAAWLEISVDELYKPPVKTFSEWKLQLS